MGVPKKRTSSMRRNRRRAANFRISPANVAKCSKCKEPVLSHRVCPSCGSYDGEQVRAGQ